MWQEWKEDQKFNFLRWLVKEEESELNTYIHKIPFRSVSVMNSDFTLDKTKYATSMQK